MTSESRASSVRHHRVNAHRHFVGRKPTENARPGTPIRMSDINEIGEISHDEIRSAVRDLCARFPGEYWRDVDRREAYPEEFVAALTAAGWLAALIPPDYGGAGLGLGD